MEEEPIKTRSHSDGMNKKLQISKNLKPKLIEITKPPVEKIKKIKKNLTLSSSSPIRTRFNLRPSHPIMKMAQIKTEKKAEEKTNKKLKKLNIKSEPEDNKNEDIVSVRAQRKFESQGNHQIITSSPVINPINWGSKDVCKYLIENKFDPNLVYLIEEHVIRDLF